MANKSFRSLHDFVRHGTDMWLTCGNGACDHHGVVSAHDAVRWFRLHRFSDSLTGALGSPPAHDHFRCSRCGSRAGHIAPTNQPVTVIDFFPLTPDAWRKLARHKRG